MILNDSMDLRFFLILMNSFRIADSGEKIWILNWWKKKKIGEEKIFWKRKMEGRKKEKMVIVSICRVLDNL